MNKNYPDPFANHNELALNDKIPKSPSQETTTYKNDMQEEINIQAENAKADDGGDIEIVDVKK